MQSAKQLVLVGGGHAHLSVLQALAQRRPSDVHLVLITPSIYQNYSGMLPGWMAGQYEQSACRVDLRPLAQAAGVRLLNASVVGMDANRRCVALTDGKRVDYDWLSLDVGSEADTSWLQALGERMLPVKPLDVFFQKWPQVLAQAKKQSSFRLVVVGAGAAGVEVALAAHHALASNAVQAQVDLVASESGLLQGHAVAVQRRVQRYVTAVGIRLHCQRGVGLDDAVLLADGTRLKADCVIATTGARAPIWLQGTGLALDKQGYIEVDQYHRSASHPDVFAVGDVCTRVDVALARSGVHAVHAGPVLAANVLASMAGTALKPYHPKARSLYLLACGPKYAIMSWGRWSAQGSWVWRWKDWIDQRFIRRFAGEVHTPEIALLKEPR